MEHNNLLKNHADAFTHRWKAVLSQVADKQAYAYEADEGGWDRLPTKNMPFEAQADITAHARSLSGNDVLVINHGYGPWIDFSGNRIAPDSSIKAHYLTNLDRLLRDVDTAKISPVMFDYPEMYVLDSRARLFDESIATVVLTPYDGGGSLFKGSALRQIGHGKHVYIAGSYLPCIATTLEELYDNDNEIIIVDDAVLVGESAIDGTSNLDQNREKVRDAFMRDCNVDTLSFISLNTFLEKYSK